MRSLEEVLDEQPWQELLKTKYGDLDARERLFDSSSIHTRSIDELLEETVLQPSERKRIRIRNQICWLTAANAMMLGIAVVLKSLSKLPWSTPDTRNCVKATSFFCKSCHQTYSLLKALNFCQRQ